MSEGVHISTFSIHKKGLFGYCLIFAPPDMQHNVDYVVVCSTKKKMLI